MNRITGIISYPRPKVTPPLATMTPPGEMGDVYRMLVRAAERREVCPSNETIAEMIGKGVAAASGVVTRLEEAGWITVERFHRSRVVSIRDTALSTARPKTESPHWSRRKAAATQAGGGK